MKFSPIFTEIEKRIKQGEPVIVGIDGRCGSGKSYLASLLQETFDCNVFHMDDFFLPSHMRTQKRLEEPGGNVHYERFASEIMIPLMEGKTVTYRPYHCGTGEYGEPVYVQIRKLTIVEGAYCLHPKLIKFYNYKIFLTLDKKVQEERILKRNGKEKLSDFLNLWIPMEEKYFKAFNIAKQCDIVIDTSDK